MLIFIHLYSSLNEVRFNRCQIIPSVSVASLFALVHWQHASIFIKYVSLTVTQGAQAR